MAAKALESLRAYHSEQAAKYARVAENEHRMSPDWAVAEAPEKRLFHLAAAVTIEDALAMLQVKDPTGEIAAGRLMLAHVYAWMRAPGSHFPHGFAKIADTVKAFLATLPRGMRQWQHKKRGSAYGEIGLLIVQTEQPLHDGAALVVYIGEKGDLYGRPPEEFADGRFEEIKA